jgi:hypothetical protein
MNEVDGPASISFLFVQRRFRLSFIFVDSGFGKADRSHLKANRSQIKRRTVHESGPFEARKADPSRPRRTVRSGFAA